MTRTDVPSEAFADTTIIVECADCDKPAVVGWSHSPHFDAPVWLCADHFDTWLDQRDQPFDLVTAP